MIRLSNPLHVSGTFTLTDDIYWPHNRGAAIVATGPATINLNGHRIIGVGGQDNISIGIFANNQSNITVLNGTIQGFSIGVNVLDSVAKSTEGFSQTNNRIVNMTLRDCLTNGFILGGQGNVVDDTVIFNIGRDGQDLPRAIGGQFFGPNSTFRDSRVYNLYGGSESVGVSFSGRMQDGATVVNSVIDGRVGSGQSFGIWCSDPVPFTVINSTISDWDYALGGPTEVRYSQTTFARNGSNFGSVPGGGHESGTGSTIIPPYTYPATDDVIIGDAAGRRYKAGQGNDFIVGMEGHDHLFGNEGADTFAYITPASVFDKDVIMDLVTSAGDHMGFAREIYGAAADANGKPRLQYGTEAVGNKATFLEDTKSYTFYYDPDGAGGAAKIPIAYVPYMILTADDLTFLDTDASSHAIKRFALSWTAQAVGDFNNDGNADLLWRSSAGKLSEWVMLDGVQAAAFALPAMSAAHVVGEGDFNGDTVTDLLWQDAAGVVTAWFMSHGRVVAGARFENFKGWQLAAAGDFNGDGTDDMLWQSPAGKLSEWLMFNGALDRSIGTLPVMQGSKVISAGDFNGDGTTDLIWQNAAGANSVWLMDNGQRASTLALASMKGWTNIAAGDFNGDGTDDLLWRHDASGALVQWDMKDGKQSDVSYFGQSVGHEFLGVGRRQWRRQGRFVLAPLGIDIHQGLAAVTPARSQAWRRHGRCSRACTRARSGLSPGL